jgi:hypothetical protein
MSKRVLMDIAGHFSLQIHQLVLDTLDTLDHADIDSREASVALATVLLLQGASGSMAAEMSRDAFMSVCEQSRRRAEEAVHARAKAKRARSSAQSAKS